MAGRTVRLLLADVDGTLVTRDKALTDRTIEAVGRLRIAMGNSSRDVQRAARRCTSSKEEEGFAKAVDRFILAKERT